MKRPPFLVAALVLVVLVVAGSLILLRDRVPAPATITIDGSSTVYPLTEAAIRSYRGSARVPDGAFRLDQSGTSAGFRRFCSGETAVNNASRPISREELAACEENDVAFLELPVAFDAISVVVHPSNNWATTISLEELRRLWNKQAEGTVERWDQVRDQWPDKAIRLFGPGEDSGTFDYFNKAVNGEATNSRSDVVTSENDNVLVDAVAQDPLALAYFGFDYLENNRERLKAVAIQADSDAPAVLPSVETVQDGSYQPFARPLFLYVNDSILQQSAELRRFLNHTLTRGPQLAADSGAIPLLESTYRLTEAKVYKRVLGTAYGGRLPIGLTLSEVLNKSLDQDKKADFKG